MSRRPRIAAPNGREYKGRPPEAMPNTGEGPYIAELARHTQGLCEVVLPVGRADAACDSSVFEVEPAVSWRAGVRQVLAYAGQTGWAPALALFGPADYLAIYLFLRDRIPAVTLWIWRGHWERTTSRVHAVRKHAPLIGMAPSAVDQVGTHPGQVSRWEREVRMESPDLGDDAVSKLAGERRQAFYVAKAAHARSFRRGPQRQAASPCRRGSAA